MIRKQSGQGQRLRKETRRNPRQEAIAKTLSKAQKTLPAEIKFAKAFNVKELQTQVLHFNGMLRDFAQEGMRFEGLMFESQNALKHLNEKLEKHGCPKITREELQEAYNELLIRHHKPKR